MTSRCKGVVQYNLLPWEDNHLLGMFVSTYMSKGYREWSKEGLDCLILLWAYMQGGFVESDRRYLSKEATQGFEHTKIKHPVYNDWFIDNSFFTHDKLAECQNLVTQGKNLKDAMLICWKK